MAAGTQIASLYAKIGADTSELNSALTASGAKLNAFGGQMGTATGKLSKMQVGMAGAAAGMAALPFLAVGKDALDMGMDYERSMNIMQATSSATGGEMKQIGALAKELGADMTLPATSAADAARAMTELAKSGLSVNNVMKAAKGTLQLAAAGTLSEARAAEIASNALNAFHLEGAQATRVADLLAAAANASSGEVTDMADSLKQAASIFGAAGIPIEHLVTAISEMANAGIKGGDAGTSLKTMMLSLQAPSKQAAAIMEEFGIKIYDASGAMLPLPNIINQFSTSLGRLTAEERDAALAVLFGSHAIQAANIVLMGGVDAFNKMEVAVTKQGAAQDLAAAKTKGAAGAFEGLKSQMETLMLEAAEPLLPVLEGIVRAIAGIVGAFTSLPGPVMTAIVVGVLLVGGLLALTGAVLGTTAGVMMLGPAFIVVKAAMIPMIATLGAIALPVLAIGAAIALVAIAWSQNWGDIQGKTQAAMEFIQTTITNLMTGMQTTITTVLGAIQGFWQAHGEQVMLIVTGAWTIISTIVETWINIIFGIITTVMQLISGDWEGAWETIQGTTERVWKAIDRIIDTATAMIQAALDIWYGSLKIAAELAWNAFKELINSVWEATKTLIGDAMQWIYDKVKEKQDALYEKADEVWHKLEGMIRTVVDSIKGILQGFIDKINAVIDAIRSVIDWIGRIPSSIGLSIGSVAGAGSTDSTQFREIGMAEGGIVTRPTLALIGERGPEAVVPLGRGGGGSQINVYIQAPIYGVNQVEDVIVNAIESASRKGRLNQELVA